MASLFRYYDVTISLLWRHYFATITSLWQSLICYYDIDDITNFLLCRHYAVTNFLLCRHYDVTMTSLIFYYDVTMMSLIFYYAVTMTSLIFYYDVTMMSLIFYYDVTMTSLIFYYDVTMMSLGYSFRLTYEDFITKYQTLGVKVSETPDFGNPALPPSLTHMRNVSKKILLMAGITGAKFGHTLLFLKYFHHDILVSKIKRIVP